jgi:hypothetical protein
MLLLARAGCRSPVRDGRLPGERGLKQRLGLHAIAHGGKGAEAYQEREPPSESLFLHTPPPVSAYRVNAA